MPWSTPRRRRRAGASSSTIRTCIRLLEGQLDRHHCSPPPRVVREQQEVAIPIQLPEALACVAEAFSLPPSPPALRRVPFFPDEPGPIVADFEPEAVCSLAPANVDHGCASAISDRVADRVFDDGLEQHGRDQGSSRTRLDAHAYLQLIAEAHLLDRHIVAQQLEL